jgi:hypothetical protein
MLSQQFKVSGTKNVQVSSTGKDIIVGDITEVKIGWKIPQKVMFGASMTATPEQVLHLIPPVEINAGKFKAPRAGKPVKFRNP